jgi:tRNA1(Val) A37 N6-methylase TrmN6
VDLGSGVGAVSLAYAHWGLVLRADLVEQQADLVELAQKNLAENRVAGSVHRTDLTGGLPRELRGVADIVVSNPPYFSRGNTAGATSRASARHGDVSTFLSAAAAAMGRRAHAFFIYPAPALPELLLSARSAGLSPKVLQHVHAFDDSPARVVLVDFRRAKPGGLVVLPPIIEWASKGARSPLLSRLTSGRR